MHPAFNDIGAHLRLHQGLAPQAVGAGSFTGPAIDRRDFHSAVVHVGVGSADGAPSAQSVDVVLQGSADGTAGWSDLPGGAVASLTSDGAEAGTAVDLSGAPRYLRAVATVAFTGGTAPSLPVAAALVLGGAIVLPAG